MIYFSFGNIEFDVFNLIAFIVGIFAGFALLFLIYAILVLSSLKKKKYKSVEPAVIVTDEEVKEIVDNARKVYSDKKLKGAKSSVNHCMEICTAMANDIARKFYPDSKRPIAELTIDELLILVKYISDRINDIIDRPALRLVKKIKLSTILALGDTKKAIDDSSLMKMTKKYKVMKVFSAVKDALNIFNPVYWAKRALLNTSLDFAVNKICLSAIGIVGEELYTIYSKRVFEEDRYIDTNVSELVESLEGDLANVSDEDVDLYIASQGLEEKISKKKRSK